MTLRGRISPSGPFSESIDAALAERITFIEGQLNATLVPWTSVADLTGASFEMIYDGADADITLSLAPGPYAGGTFVSFLVRANSLTAPHTVVVPDSMVPSGDDFDPTLDYRVVIQAISETTCWAMMRQEPATDLTPPTVLTVTTLTSTILAVEFSKSVTCPDTPTNRGAFSLPPLAPTVTAIAGAGTTYQFTISSALSPGDVCSLAYDASNEVVDAFANVLAPGSTSVTNTLAPPGVNLWEDLFAGTGAIDPSWTTVVAAQRNADAWEYTADGAGYSLSTNLGTGTLPADLRVTVGIPDALLADTYWGLVACVDGVGNGIRLLHPGTAVLTVGNSITDAAGDVPVTVTGGYPAGWTDPDAARFLALDLAGNLATIYCACTGTAGAYVEYGTADITSLTHAAAGRVGFCGQPSTGRRYLDIRVSNTGTDPT